MSSNLSQNAPSETPPPEDAPQHVQPPEDAQAPENAPSPRSLRISGVLGAELRPGFELVVVERSFEEPVQFDSIQALEDGFAWCLEQHDITALGSYFSRDGRRMICLYQARDAESVRAANRKSKMPFEKVWTASLEGVRR